MQDLSTWLQAKALERPDIKPAIDKIKSKLEDGKNIESIVEDDMQELKTIESNFNNQFA